MKLPFVIDQEEYKGYVMKLNKFIYGLKQASSNWFEHLTTGLKSRDLFLS